MRIVHLRDQQRRPFATLVTQGDCIGISVCSPNDKFCKKRGREIAIGRMERSENTCPLVMRKVRNIVCWDKQKNRFEFGVRTTISDIIVKSARRAGFKTTICVDLAGKTEDYLSFEKLLDVK